MISVVTGMFSHIFLFTISSIFVDLLAAQGVEVGEIEPHPLRRHQRARLLDMGPQHAPEGGVEQVRDRVVRPDQVPVDHVDGGLDLVAGLEFAAAPPRPRG